MSRIRRWKGVVGIGFGPAHHIFPPQRDGGAEHLAAWLADHPGARLVAVDTVAKLRPQGSTNANLYAADYAAAGAFKAVADAAGVALVLVHHTRKADAEDPLDTVSGTNGLAGAADTVLVIRREAGRHDATLYVRGRDVPEAEHALGFDDAACAWTLLGDAADYRRSGERAAVLAALDGLAGGLAPKDLAEALGKTGGAVRVLLHRMQQAGEVVNTGGRYALPPGNTGNGVTHTGADPVTALHLLPGGDTPATAAARSCCVACGAPLPPDRRSTRAPCVERAA